MRIRSLSCMGIFFLSLAWVHSAFPTTSQNEFTLPIFLFRHADNHIGPNCFNDFTYEHSDWNRDQAAAEIDGWIDGGHCSWLLNFHSGEDWSRSYAFIDVTSPKFVIVTFTKLDTGRPHQFLLQFSRVSGRLTRVEFLKEEVASDQLFYDNYVEIGRGQTPEPIQFYDRISINGQAAINTVIDRAVQWDPIALGQFLQRTLVYKNSRIADKILEIEMWALDTLSTEDFELLDDAGRLESLSEYLNANDGNAKWVPYLNEVDERVMRRLTREASSVFLQRYVEERRLMTDPVIFDRDPSTPLTFSDGAIELVVDKFTTAEGIASATIVVGSSVLLGVVVGYLAPSGVLALGLGELGLGVGTAAKLLGVGQVTVAGGMKIGFGLMLVGRTVVAVYKSNSSYELGYQLANVGVDTALALGGGRWGYQLRSTSAGDRLLAPFARPFLRFIPRGPDYYVGTPRAGDPYVAADGSPVMNGWKPNYAISSSTPRTTTASASSLSRWQGSVVAAPLGRSEGQLALLLKQSPVKSPVQPKGIVAPNSMAVDVALTPAAAPASAVVTGRLLTTVPLSPHFEQEISGLGVLVAAEDENSEEGPLDIDRDKSLFQSLPPDLLDYIGSVQDWVRFGRPQSFEELEENLIGLSRNLPRPDSRQLTTKFSRFADLVERAWRNLEGLYAREGLDFPWRPFRELRQQFFDLGFNSFSLPLLESTVSETIDRILTEAGLEGRIRISDPHFLLVEATKPITSTIQNSLQRILPSPSAYRVEEFMHWPEELVVHPGDDLYSQASRMLGNTDEGHSSRTGRNQEIGGMTLFYSNEDFDIVPFVMIRNTEQTTTWLHEMGHVLGFTFLSSIVPNRDILNQVLDGVHVSGFAVVHVLDEVRVHIEMASPIESETMEDDIFLSRIFHFRALALDYLPVVKKIFARLLDVEKQIGELSLDHPDADRIKVELTRLITEFPFEEVIGALEEVYREMEKLDDPTLMRLTLAGRKHLVISSLEAIENSERFTLPTIEALAPSKQGTSGYLKQGGKGAIPQVGRNDPCPCGSGKKYKKCHGK